MRARLGNRAAELLDRADHVRIGDLQHLVGAFSGGVKRGSLAGVQALRPPAATNATAACPSPR